VADVSSDVSSDEDACSVIRSTYGRSLALDRDTLSVIVFIDVAQSP